MAVAEKKSGGATFSVGQVIEVSGYPFVRTVFNGYDEDRGEYQDEGWRPGCERDADDDGGEIFFGADGFGMMLLEVVQTVALPGNFASRIFYVRRWRDPDGKEFGKRLLRVTSLGSFVKMLKGYRHPFFFDGEEVFPKGRWAHVEKKA